MMNQRISSLFIVVSLAIALMLTLLPLPDTLAVARPAFYPMTVMFWVATQSERFGLIAAWCCGLPLDVLYGTPLSEHGLALAVACYAMLKGRDLLGNAPLVQQTLLMLPVFAIYAFLLYWIDGVARLNVNLWWRWLPVLSSTVVWPLWTLGLERFAGREVGD